MQRHHAFAGSCRTAEPQSGRCRWCCSGTPISTEIKDFTSQFAFLNVALLSKKAYFTHFVSPDLAPYPVLPETLSAPAAQQHPLLIDVSLKRIEPDG